MIRDKRGMIGIFAVGLIMILAAIMAIVLFGSTYNANSLSINQQKSFQNYQNAVVGAARGIWLLKHSYVLTPARYPANGYDAQAAAIGANVYITYNGATSTSTITSTSGNSTVTATYSGGMITSWN